MEIAPSERATGVALATLSAFQAALAAGAPWGRAAYGGTRHGTLPSPLRAVSGVTALGYGAGAALVLRGSGSPRTRARAFATLSMFMGLGTVVNAASPSAIERAVWTPVTMATAVAAWRSRTART